MDRQYDSRRPAGSTWSPGTPSTPSSDRGSLFSPSRFFSNSGSPTWSPSPASASPGTTSPVMSSTGEGVIQASVAKDSTGGFVHTFGAPKKDPTPVSSPRSPVSRQDSAIGSSGGYYSSPSRQNSTPSPNVQYYSPSRQESVSGPTPFSPSRSDGGPFAAQQKPYPTRQDSRFSNESAFSPPCEVSSPVYANSHQPRHFPANRQESYQRPQRYPSVQNDSYANGDEAYTVSSPVYSPGVGCEYQPTRQSSTSSVQSSTPQRSDSSTGSPYYSSVKQDTPSYQPFRQNSSPYQPMRQDSSSPYQPTRQDSSSPYQPTRQDSSPGVQMQVRQNSSSGIPNFQPMRQDSTPGTYRPFRQDSFQNASDYQPTRQTSVQSGPDYETMRQDSSPGVISNHHQPMRQQSGQQQFTPVVRQDSYPVSPPITRQDSYPAPPSIARQDSFPPPPPVMRQDSSQGLSNSLGPLPSPPVQDLPPPPPPLAQEDKPEFRSAPSMAPPPPPPPPPPPMLMSSGDDVSGVPAWKKQIQANKEARAAYNPSQHGANTAQDGPNAPFSYLPPALQGNMKRDKKPFTYLPGGLDLSEIKSPKMQRRIMANQQHAPPPPSCTQKQQTVPQQGNDSRQNVAAASNQLEGLNLADGSVTTSPGDGYHTGSLPRNHGIQYNEAAADQPKNYGQSRSFRILQMMTDNEDGDQESQAEKQKMKRSDEDEMKFTGLRKDAIPSRAFQTLQRMTGGEDPAPNNYGDANTTQDENQPSAEDGPVDIRYKGAYIPGKSFKMLQEMTGEGGTPVPSVLQQKSPRKAAQLQIQVGGPCDSPQQPPKQFPHPSVPASQQSVEEAPKMYRGSRIPSQSFRILQAMTGENSGAPEEDGTDL